MRRLIFIGSTFVLVLSVALAIVIAIGPKGGGVGQPIGNSVVSDLGITGMLEADQPMLDQMRVSNRLGANAMFDQHPMWFDSDMIRSQEAYQAQLDRMVGRRTGHP